jgi:hypothetical protein
VLFSVRGGNQATDQIKNKMNSITKAATKITSITLTEFIEAGGELTSLETVNRGEGDREIHVFEAEGRDGSYISDNAGVSWFDAPAASVVAALNSGDTSEIGDAKGVSTI